MTIRLNDEPRTVPPAITLHALLQELGLGERKGVAVAVNDAVVPRKTWTDRALAEAVLQKAAEAVGAQFDITPRGPVAVLLNPTPASPEPK